MAKRYLVSLYDRQDELKTLSGAVVEGGALIDHILYNMMGVNAEQRKEFRTVLKNELSAVRSCKKYDLAVTRLV